MRNFLIAFLLLATHLCFGKLWMPSIWSDNMVLQQKTEVTIWGWTTSANETITITGSWNNVSVTVKAHQGSWSVQLPTHDGGGPHTVTVDGHEKIVIENVLIGEVWLGSGQSNMQWTPEDGLANAEEEIANANYPSIRFFNVARKKSSHPQDDLVGEWVVCTPDTMRKFSSVAYFFGRKLYKSLETPVGLINSSWGGTPVEVWIEEERVTGDEELNEAASKLKEFEWWPTDPGTAYNAMIHPIVKFDIAGCIWYQGESNRVNAFSYYKSFPVLIDLWRKNWKKELPFYFAQIAPFRYDTVTNISAAVVRDAQLQTMKTVPNTGMAVTNDIGNLKDIHPINKQDVGKRLALWALAKTYGCDEVTYSGPIFRDLEIKKRKATLTFDHVGSGLVKRGRELTEFYIAGSDQEFHKAKARIVGNTVVVSSSKVRSPIAIRFAFSDTALPNLYNEEGLPASAFRTDDWKIALE